VEHPGADEREVRPPVLEGDESKTPRTSSGIRHLRTRPRRPQTNGKAERFIRTLLNDWAYGAIYRSSNERTASLDGWLWHYNHRRPHSALGRQPPVNRTNLLGSYN
jgi:transposase InsO family protein